MCMSQEVSNKNLPFTRNKWSKSFKNFNRISATLWHQSKAKNIMKSTYQTSRLREKHYTKNFWTHRSQEYLIFRTPIPTLSWFFRKPWHRKPRTITTKLWSWKKFPISEKKLPSCILRIIQFSAEINLTLLKNFITTANSWERSSGGLMTIQRTLGSVILLIQMSIWQLTLGFPSWLGIWLSWCKFKEGQNLLNILAFRNLPHSGWNPINTRHWPFHQLSSHSVKITNDTKIMSSNSMGHIKAVESVF